MRELLKEALSGTEQDFTEGSLTRGIALLAIPTMLEMVMESTFAVVDAFWVAKLGANAMAATGLTEAVVLAGVLLGIVGGIFAPQLLSLMHAEPGVIAIGTGFARIILGGNIVILM